MISTSSWTGLEMRRTQRAVSAKRDQEERSGCGEQNEGEGYEKLDKLGCHSSAVVSPEAVLASIKQAMEKGSGQRKAMAPAKAVERMSDSASANHEGG